MLKALGLSWQEHSRFETCCYMRACHMASLLCRSYFRFATAAAAASLAAVTIPSAVNAATFTADSGALNIDFNVLDQDLIGLGDGSVDPAPGFTAAVPFLNPNDFMFSDDGGFTIESTTPINLDGLLGFAGLPQQFENFVLTPISTNSWTLSSDFIPSGVTGDLFDLTIDTIGSVGTTLSLEGTLTPTPGGGIPPIPGITGTFLIEANASSTDPMPDPDPDPDPEPEPAPQPSSHRQHSNDRKS